MVILLLLLQFSTVESTVDGNDYADVLIKQTAAPSCMFLESVSLYCYPLQCSNNYQQFDSLLLMAATVIIRSEFLRHPGQS